MLGAVHVADLTQKSFLRLIPRQDSHAISSEDSFCMRDGLDAVHGQ